MKRASILTVASSVAALVVAMGAVVAQSAATAVSASAVDAWIEATRQTGPDGPTALRIGLALRAQGRADEAAKWLDLARSLDPQGFEQSPAGRAEGEGAGGATPRTVCGGSTGPDVIVGDLQAVIRWGRSGSLTAYSLATTSCNLGDAPLNWIELDANHPVIAQSFYKLRNGRFTQIGMSWLKHGFFATNEVFCCACTTDPGAFLGPGCSDPYGANLNGWPPYLGPRHQVNPATGVITYPHATPTGDATLMGRVQVSDDDASPSLNPGAQYFMEGYYIATDDAAAGNNMNNASYRPINMIETVPGEYQATIIQREVTRRELPAIYGWREMQPTVTIVNADVPGDGRFILAYDVTPNGDGTWRYEYALYNYNSDRCGRYFLVPLPAGVALSQVGFHDVDYHSGDGVVTGVNQSGVDWPVTVSASSVSWVGDTIVQNPNANALGWGTLYNFWFNASRPPASAMVTLGLFKLGSPATVKIAAVAPSACPADITGDGLVNSADLALLLGAWGMGGPSDLNGDGVVGSGDLALLLGAWGPCP